MNYRNLWNAVAGIALIFSIIGLVGGHQSVPRAGNVLNGQYTSYNGLALVDGTSQQSFGSGVNGINTLSVQRSAITSGTTTPCAILSPASTSTLLNFSLIPTVGTTTSSTLTFATSTTAFATTTALETLSSYLPMQSFNYNATTSVQRLDLATIPPSTWLVVGLAAQTATGGHVMTGFCTATLLTQ